MNNRGIKLGRIFGFEVRITWSWLIIFGLITWNLASAFGQIHSDWIPLTTVGIAVAASLLFFLSVLIHELAHSLAARSRGMAVGSITLFLFGGVADIQDRPPTPWAEFLMAIVGPLVSLVLGLGFILLSGVGITSLEQPLTDLRGFAAQLSPLTTLLLWLGPVNLTLAVFNMIPGYPLDGGRILRSIFWGITDDFKRSTRWASWIGRVIALVLIINGIAMIFGAEIPFLGSGFSNGLWIALIGLFLNNAALTSYQQVVIQDVLDEVEVGPIMHTDPTTVDHSLSVRRLVDEYIMKTDAQSFPVLQDGRLIGMVALDDVRKLTRNEWQATTVKQIMTPEKDLVSTHPNEDASRAFEKLSRSDYRQLPVLQDGSLVGMLRRSDIVKWLRLQSETVLGPSL
jgi:Zn-dependent protease